MENNLKLSVIIPIYGVESYIEKCLKSIMAQSYKNLEIICVNDATKDSSMKIVESLAKEDDRIKIVNNPQNMGLFRARVEGMKVASGAYLAFVDADDYVSCDWFRLLIKKLNEKDADMVIGNTVTVDEGGRQFYYNNYKSMTRSHKEIYAPNLLEKFFECDGSCYAWHTVWNKVYKKELIDRCLPYFNMVDYHLIMLEDVAFSSVFYTHAKCLTFADADCYFYYRRSDASTGSSLPVEKVVKNINDVGNAFEFFKKALSTYDSALYEKHEQDYKRFKKRYQKIWSNYVLNSKKYTKNKHVLEAMENAFGSRELIPSNPHDFYFYNLTTDWSNRYQYLKGLIKSDEIEVVSFDIFDTLVKRPFYKPTDLFMVVGMYAHTLFPFITADSFVRMRTTAENVARGRNPRKQEDILLSDIYETFADIYGLSIDDVRKIQENEIQCEIKYCTTRYVAKELYDFALAVGKRVIITSDMYLERDTIDKILAKNGYTGHEAVYLSSELGYLKHSGSLFKYVIKDLDIKAKNILHIGDTWNSDIVQAEKQGIKTHFLPKAIETYENKIADIYTGDGAGAFTKKICATIDTQFAIDQLPVRCAVALMANKMFDNPYTIFNRASNYNADSYYMGYSALGMHVLGVAEWMYRVAKEKGYKKIVFLARDGKMFKDAFDMLCRVRGASIETDYFYATRKALMPYSIKSAEDLYNINQFVGVYHMPPRKILDLFKAVLKPLDAEMEKEYQRRNINLDEKMTNEEEIYSFIRAMIDISYDEELNEQAWTKAREAFKKVFDENTATFDAGYSGRLQSILCDLAECSIDTFFIHSNGYNTSSKIDDKFKIHSYYDFSPTMSSIVREFFISDPTPSCYSYEIKDGEVKALLEEKTDAFSVDCVYAINEVQKGALDFVSDFLDVFGDMGEGFVSRNVDYATAFDHFLLNTTDFDRYTFISSMVEDEVFSGYNEGSLYHQWSIRVIPLNSVGNASGVCSSAAVNYEVLLCGASKLKKFMFLLMFDRKLLKQKVKPRLKKCWLIYIPAKLTYKFLRGIYRIFRRKK